MDKKATIGVLVIVGVIIVGIIIGVSSSITGKTTSSHYSCDWAWMSGQGIKYDGVRYHDCTSSRPYCKSDMATIGQPQCCAWSAAAGHYDCEDAPLYAGAETSDCGTCCVKFLMRGDIYTYEGRTIELVIASDSEAALDLSVTGRITLSESELYRSGNIVIELMIAEGAYGTHASEAVIRVCSLV